jgi:tryptophan synthase alpha chain
MNRIDKALQEGHQKILNIYFTAGYPELESSLPVMQLLQANGAGMIEIGLPFSDPLADGPVIQESSRVALENGMNTSLLFEQLKNMRQTVDLPVVLMGYLNPVIQFGMERFLQKAAEAGIDGLILPDMPAETYAEHYQKLFLKYGIHAIFLVSPQTSDGRMHYLDSLSKGFLYAVSSSSTTGRTSSFNEEHLQYFARLVNLQLHNPVMIGFGISDKEAVETVFSYASGAIIGSAFIRHLDKQKKDYGIPQFMNQFKLNQV